MDFEIVSQIVDIETIASSRNVRSIVRLQKLYGKGRWRKLKGIARIKLPNGMIRLAELHWYEAHGTGRKELKWKKYLE